MVFFWGRRFPNNDCGGCSDRVIGNYVFVMNFILHISHSLRYGLIWLHYPNASCLSICCNMMTNNHKELL